MRAAFSEIWLNMPIRVNFSPDAVWGFLLVLTRVGSALVFLPLPGVTSAPQVARIVLIIGITFCLFPLWPSVAHDDLNTGAALLAVLSETSIGLIMGLSLAFLTETFQLGAQAISMQTGFSFASTFDPSSEADSGVFQVLSQLTAGLLLFTLGIHEQLIRMFGRSLVAFSGGATLPRAFSTELVVRMGSNMFLSGLKLALPVVTLLFLVDLLLAVVSRLQQQMQLLTLAFPAKILLSLIFLSGVLTRWPSIYEHLARQMFETVFQLFKR